MNDQVSDAMTLEIQYALRRNRPLPERFAVRAWQSMRVLSDYDTEINMDENLFLHRDKCLPNLFFVRHVNSSTMEELHMYLRQ